MTLKKILLLVFISIITFDSCKKRYEDGPLISLRKPETRLQGTWEVTNYKINDVESIQYFTDSCGCSISFCFAGGFIYIGDENEIYFKDCNVYIGNSFWGHFQFEGDKNIIYIESQDIAFYFPNLKPFCETSSRWDVLRLTNKELWIQSEYQHDTYLMKCKKKE